MSATLDRHAWFIDALPAFVGGTLQAEESTAVIAHASECAACRAELTLAQRVQTHFAREWQAVAPLLDASREQAGFDRLWSRIAATEPDHRRNADPPRWRRMPFPLAALAAGVAFAVGLLWYRTAAEPDYRTLANVAPRACGQLRAQIDQQLAAGDIVRLLDAAGAHIVAGPSAEGVYTLRAADPAESLRRLRARPEVRLVEPTDC